MPIAFLISRYPDVSHTFILREILALRQRGMEIQVASINDPPASGLTAGEQEESRTTFYIKRAGLAAALRAATFFALHNPRGILRGLRYSLTLARGDLRGTAFAFFYLLEALILARWMHRRSIHHIHVHFATPASTVALLLTRIAPITFSLTVHGPDEFFHVDMYYLREKIAAASFVVCISQFARSQLMLLSDPVHWSKLIVSQLGVDSAHFAPAPYRPAPQVFQILCIGRLVPAKGQRVLIEAVEQLSRSGRAIALDLIGDGPDRLSLETLVQQRGLQQLVRFHGSINQDAIRHHLGNADSFALASFAEGIPVVLMEAMSMEIPCIATRINGIPELIDHGIDGLLIPPSDPIAMADAIALLIDDPDLRRSIAREGRRKVPRFYELSSSIERLHRIFITRLEENP